MNNHSLKTKHQGFTLIEVMIAMLLGGVLLAGVLQIFISTKQTYRLQDNLSRMQENGRFAMDFISRDIRTAGFWGCASLGSIQSKLNPDASVSPPNHPTFDSFNNVISGVNDDSTDSEIIDGTDSITLKGASGAGISLTAAGADTNAVFSVTNNSGLAADDFVVISNCTSGDIFQITAVAGGDTITHGSGNAGELGNALTQIGWGTAGSSDANIYDTSAQIHKLNFVTYLIASGSGGQPALFKHVNGGPIQELVEGVENMQILYGEDTDANGTPDYYVSANNVVDMSNVISIRIEMLMASRDDNLTSQNVNYFYNGATVTPTDNKLRQVYSSTIAVRNRIP